MDQRVGDQRVEQCVLACIVNARARSNAARDLAEHVGELLKARGARIDTILVERGGDLVPVARRYAEGGCPTIVAAGGDGTVSAVASAIVGTDAALGVLPLGTLNHFAKDAGIPLGLDAAVDTILAGHTRPVDVGEVNGRIFVNNSSIGLYPAIVAERSELQRRGVRKWVAFARAILKIMQRVPHYHVSLHADGKYDGTDKTPFLFVGNNPYHAAGFKIGRRERLDSGRLWVCTAPDANRAKLVGMAVRALLGRVSPGELKVLEAEQLWVSSRRYRRRVRVANDGELFVTHLPLHYRTRPKALRVIVPAGG